MLVKVANKDEIPIGKGKEFNANGVRIAIFNVNGRYYATEALCRHQDGPLAEGKLIGDIIECPWHFWHYNVRTGELLDFLRDVKLNVYKIEIRDDFIYVEL
ncbi:MAG: Rieske 2Fe-2S domain-containing protein [Candidatus Nitrosocaldaceae archaeon]